ncbi:MAG: 4Fe-4S binding protein [Candidatus Riflebacteria bacterium]|nr:4Fe-4S binding protein [Candidatus Riflebacteria bacterium]
MKKNVILHFKADLVSTPILSGVIRNFDVEVNILQASIRQEADGTMFIQIDGEPENVKNSFKYLEEIGVKLIMPAKNLIWDEDKCTHCSACVAHCFPKALSVDKNIGKVVFAHEKCIACELCIPACPFGALESITDHLA